MKRMAIAFLALTFATAAPVLAEEPHGAVGVFCNSLDAAKAFVDTWKGGNPHNAIEKANQGRPEDCGTADVFVMTVERYGVVVNERGTWQFVKLHVLAQRVDGAIHITDVYQYSAERIAAPMKGSAI